MEIEKILFLLDKVGIIAFAFTGVSHGIKKKLDILGLLVVGVMTAVGGGIIRDLLVAKVPYAISNIDYLAFAFVASIIAILLSTAGILIPKKVIVIADTLGLGAFSAAGIIVSLTYHLSIFHTILFSALTAAGGGLIKDILINEIPFVLRREVYATAAMAGGLIGYIAFFLNAGIVYAGFIGMLTTISLRFFAIYKNIDLPVLKISKIKE